MSKKKVCLLCLVVLSIVSCTHLKNLEKSKPRAGVALPVKTNNTIQKQVDDLDNSFSRPDNIICIDANGKEIENKNITVEFDSTLNKSGTTTVVALNEVVVVATTRRNVVERNGMIDVDFVVTVPRELQHKRCMVSLLPVLMRGTDNDTLPELRYSGAAFREEQENDYAKYDRFLSQIIPDTVDFYHTFVDYKRFNWYMQRRNGMIHQLDNHWQSLEKQKSEPSELLKRFDYFNEEAKNRSWLQRERSNQSDSARCVDIAAQIERLAGDTVRHTNIKKRTRFEFFNEQMIRNKCRFSEESAKDSLKKTLPMYYYKRPELGLFVIVRPNNELIEKLERKRDRIEQESEQNQKSDALNDFCFRETDSLKFINRISGKQLKIKKELEWLTERDSLDTMKGFYYTGKINRNERRKRDKEKKFDKIVHFPHSSTAKIDVQTTANDTLRYRYQYSIRADENSSRMRLFLTGKVQDFGGEQYSMPTSDTLTFFVSSMTFFVVDQVKYVPITIRRDAEANLNVFLNFPIGKANLIDTLGNNARELSSIKSQMAAVLTDSVYAIDSLQLVANSSPEGNWNKNMELSKARAEAVERFLQKELHIIADSVAEGFSVEIDENNNVITHSAPSGDEESESGVQDITKNIRVGWNGEDWETLSALIGSDDKIAHKADILKIIEKEKQPDVREALIASRFKEDYKYMRAHLYPKLRSVNFHFFLRRKGMKEEVIYTNAIDTMYQRGIALLRKRRYEDALKILKPYEDVNTAVAYMSLGYNEAAGRVLNSEKETAHVCYLKAIVGARLKNEKKAVEDFLKACELDSKLRFRGNLDPELSVLINKYELFLDDF